MLNYHMDDKGVLHYTTKEGEAVGTISYKGVRGYLVEATEAYMHGTSTMWWKSLKAAEYHMLAIYHEAL